MDGPSATSVNTEHQVEDDNVPSWDDVQENPIEEEEALIEEEGQNIQPVEQIVERRGARRRVKPASHDDYVLDGEDNCSSGEG